MLICRNIIIRPEGIEITSSFAVFTMKSTANASRPVRSGVCGADHPVKARQRDARRNYQRAPHEGVRHPADRALRFQHRRYATAISSLNRRLPKRNLIRIARMGDARAGHPSCRQAIACQEAASTLPASQHTSAWRLFIKKKTNMLVLSPAFTRSKAGRVR